MRTSRYFDIKRGPDGRPFLEAYVDSLTLLRFGLLSKGTAFTPDERRDLGLEGLLPPQIATLEEQVQRAYRAYQAAATALDKYQFLRGLQERQEVLFYALLERHLDEMLPIVYTPTVGDAVRHFSALYQSPRGLSLSIADVDRAAALAANYPLNDVRMIVATDSSAILGIGDQGYGGLAIPIGKLALYTVGGGLAPYHTMPVALDVGTDRQDLLEDPDYLGARRRRLRGEAYLRFLDAFVDAVRARWPGAVIQWEDLAKDAAFTVLERYRRVVPSFNDDIQGTGAVALAGVLGACRLLGSRLRDQVIVVHGAGAGGAGVAMALRQALLREGLSPEEARARLYVLDSRGLLVDDRPMEDYKRELAQPRARIEGWGAGTPGLLETIERTAATALLGLSGQPRCFGEPVVRAMARNAPRPVIFPLSNPTSVTEADPDDVARWSDGRAIVATGSPFPPVRWDGVERPVPQGNNAFIFPGLGHAAVLAGAREITDGMVLEAALALADYTAARHLDRVYPPVAELQEVSVAVAARVLCRAAAEGVATATAVARPGLEVAEAESLVRASFWRAAYLPVVRG